MSTATPIQPAPTAPLPLHVVRAVTRYEIATARYDELDARPASTLSPAEVEAFHVAQLTLTEALCTLAEAKRLDLIEPAETAARYWWASVRCRRLVESADFEGCAEAQDVMRMCRCQLADVGRLDLIEVPLSPDIQRAVVRYGIAAETLAGLESIRISTPVQFRQLADAQDTIKESRATLADAGLLHLIASDDHDKTREPRLPQRPRGPHPQTAGA